MNAQTRKNRGHADSQPEPITTLIPYRGHSGLAEFTEQYLALEAAVDAALAAHSAVRQTTSELIPWDTVAAKFPTQADRDSAEGKAFIDKRARREIACSRAHTVWHAAYQDLFQAMAVLNCSGLNRLSRQFKDSERAQEINAGFDPFERRSSERRYYGTALPQGMKHEQFAAIEKEPKWDLQPYQRDIAINNFVCGVELFKRATRLYNEMRGFPSRPGVGGMLVHHLIEAQTFFQTIPALREGYTCDDQRAALAEVNAR